MTEEEKKAIEKMQDYIQKNEAFVFYSKQWGETDETCPRMEFYNIYRTVLNLIEKLQKEIKLNEKLVDQLSYDMLKYFNYYNCKNNREIVEIYKRRILECDTNE